MSFWPRRRGQPDMVRETIVAADVKARAEVLLDQMSTNLDELKGLILGREGDERRGGSRAPDG